MISKIIPRSRTRTTKWSLFFHYASIAIVIVSGLLVVPLYLKFIPNDTYGAWLATGNILVWITSIDPGLSSVLQQKVASAYGKQDVNNIHELVSGGLLITSVIVTLVGISGLIIANYLANWLNLSANVDIELIVNSFKFAVFGTCLMMFSFSITSINQGLQSSLGIGLIFVAVTITSILLNIVLLYFGFSVLSMPMSLIFRGGGLLIGNLAYLTWRLNTEKIGMRFDFSNISPLVKLLSYTFLARVGSIVTSNIDLFIVARFIGVEIVPALTFTRQIPEISKPLLERPVIAFMPSLSHMFGAGDFDRASQVLLRLLRFISWTAGLITGGFISFNQDFIRLWIGEKFFAGHDINLLICIGIVVSVISSCFGNLCFSMGNIKGNSLVSLIQSFLYVPLVIFGTIHFGLIGIVAAPLISNLLTSFWYFPKSFMKIMKISSTLQKTIFWEFFKVILVSIILTVIFSELEIFNWLSFSIYTSLFGISYCLSLGIISKDFRYELKSIFNRFVV